MAAVRNQRLRVVFGALVVVGSVVAGAAALWAGSGPGGDLGAVMVAFAAAVVTLLVFGGLVVVCVLDRRFAVPLLVPPLVFGAVWLADRSDLPLRARFAQARPAFERTVLDRAAGSETVCPTWAGSYRVLSCRTVGPDTFFAVRGGFLDDVGFAHRPRGGQPAGPDSVRYEPLSGPWYTYSIPF